MERNKNRTDLLAAGRKKLQQFRQKKDHKSSNSRASEHAKSPKESGNHEDVDSAEIIPHLSSAVMESEEPLAKVNAIEPDAAEVSQKFLPVTELLVNLAIEGSSSTMAPGMDDLGEHKEDPSSSFQTSNQDPDTSGAEVFNKTCENLSGSCGIEMLKNERDGDDEDTSTADVLSLELPDGGQADDSVIDVTDMLSCQLSEDVIRFEEDISTSAGGINYEANSTDRYQEVFQAPSTEILKDESSFLSQDLVVDRHKMGEDAVSLDQSASKREEGAAKLADEKGMEKFDVEETEEENPLREEYQFLQKNAEVLQRERETSTSSISRLSPRNKDIDMMEILKTHLYLTTFTKDFLQIQIEECDLNLPGEVSRLQDLIKEHEEREAGLRNELSQFEADLQAIHSSNNDLKSQYLSARGEIEELMFKFSQVKNELELSRKGSIDLTTELVECSNVLGALKTENSKLSEEIIAKEEELHNLKAEKESSAMRIEELNDRIHLLTNEMEDSSGETAKLLAELADCKLIVLSLQTENSDLTSQIILGSQDLNKIKAHKEHLENENKNIAATLSDQKDQLSAALEKNAQLEGEFKETIATVEKLTEENLYLLNSLDVHQLKLKELMNVPQDQDSMENADHSFGQVGESNISLKAEESLRKLEDAVVGMYEHLKADDTVSASGVSRLIQAFESKAHASSAPSDELLHFFNLVKVEINKLRSIVMHLNLDTAIEKIPKGIEQQGLADEFIVKLAEFKENINSLQIQLDSTCENAEGISGRLLNRVELLQKEVNGIGESLEELSLMKNMISMSSQNLGADSHPTSSVQDVIKMIKDMQDELEAACVDRDKSRSSYEEIRRDYDCLHEKNIADGRMLHGIYQKMCEHTENSSNLGEDCVDFEAVSDLLNKILNENLQLKFELTCRNKAMEGMNEKYNNLMKDSEEVKSLLAMKNQNFDVLNRGCLALVQELEIREINGKLHPHDKNMNPEKTEADFVSQLLLRMKEMISLISRDREEATQQLNLSKSHLLEAFSLVEMSNTSQSEALHTIIKNDIAPRISELLETKEELNLLTSKALSQEKEIQSFKDTLKKTEEALEVARSELEQSEQKLTSVREKLGIAVSKGKGLVVQRDSLKQSLVDVSSELEICKQELQAMEAKLKSSEADRIEALESELSYIRNSATQFRDYFLQKDSLLQKIEETVEELDLPDELHSKDVVEKVEWLAKSVSRSASILTESDDLKRKYEELQSKFYALAEQNDMLDQSLRERNSLVQRLEKAIDGIDMPPQLRSVETEDRVEWLGRKLSEVQQERNSLSAKVDQLDADLVAAGQENKVLLIKLDELGSELSEFSKRASQTELERENLQREMFALQEELMDKVSDVQSLEELKALKAKLDDVYGDLEATREERDAAIDKYSSQRDELLEERDRAANKYQSIFSEFELMIKQRDLLQDQLKQEEQRSASAREKLAVAVRKGKGLVQQRDSLKQTLEETNKAHKELLNALHSIDLVNNVNIVDPIQKIKGIQAAIQSSADEVAKSKRAAELLFAELNEVQERADSLQLEKDDALSHLDRLAKKHEEERRIHAGSIMELRDGLLELRKGLLGLTDALALAVSIDVDLFCSLQSNLSFMTKLVDGTHLDDISLLVPINLPSVAVAIEGKSSAVDGFFESDASRDDDGSLMIEYLKLATHVVHECAKNLAHLKDKLINHSSAVDQYSKDLSQTMEATQIRVSSENLRETIDDKEKEVNSLRKILSLMFEACQRSVLELENRQKQMVAGKSEASLNFPVWFTREGSGERETPFTEDMAREVADSMVTIAESLGDAQKAIVSDMRREMQEKDAQQTRICAELVSQIRDAEAAAERFSADLHSAKKQVEELQSQIEEMKSDRSHEQRIDSLMISLTAKDQEIESLMQALDEEESQMEALQRRNQELAAALETTESSRSKALTKLATTLTGFEELRRLSESLLSEMEDLQSQMQERESEISFLRREAARCTDEALLKQESNRKLSSHMDEVLTRMETLVSRLGGDKVNVEGQNHSRIHVLMECLEKQIPAAATELEDLRSTGQRKDAQLSELSRKVEVLEASLQERESRYPRTPDSLELEPVINKRSALGTSSSTSFARGGRRVNSDQVSVAIDLGEDDLSLQEDDDDKAHGFKSLTMSKVVPRAARPVADRIDGLWVAIERLLMRQPSLRLGLILYWVLLHAMLAASV